MYNKVFKNNSPYRETSGHLGPPRALISREDAIIAVIVVVVVVVLPY